MHRSLLISGLATTLALGPLSAQEEVPDLRGTWLLDGSTVVSIYDLVDFMPGGEHQLTFFEPTSGRVRTLHLRSQESDARAPAVSQPEWIAGPAWFQQDPVEVRVRAEESREGRADRLSWLEGSDSLRAVRIHYPTLPLDFESLGDRLSGTLILPPGHPIGEAADGTRPEKALPAIVLVHGSGRATREFPRAIGELFARSGIAAYIYDKRGTGASGGDFAGSTVGDFAADAGAAVAAVAAHPAIDRSRIAVMVSSEGGLAVPEVVEAHPELAAVVCRVCPVRPGTETSVMEARGRVAAAGLSEASADSAERFVRAQQRYALTGEGYEEFVRLAEESEGTSWARLFRAAGAEPMARDSDGWRYYRDFLSADPWAVYERFEGPVLGIFGGLDERIPRKAHAEALRDLLAGSGHPASEVWILEGATHGLFLSETGSGTDPGPIRGYPPGWHDRLVDWVAARLGG